MYKKLCKGGCGDIATYKGWCKIGWKSGNKFGVACPIIFKKRNEAISKFRLEESKLGKNPMQNPEICKKNHSEERNKKVSITLKMLGEKGLLPQQTESPELKEKRRKNNIKANRKLLKEGKHPRQLETIEQKEVRRKKIANTIQKLASENKLYVQNMSKEQKDRFAQKISKTIRRKIKNGKIKLSPSWKKVPYKEKVLRSNWEKEVAIFLDENNIEWIYEPFVIQYFDSSRKVKANTIPDFYLPQYNTIIEVKSNAEFKSKKTQDKTKAIKKSYHFILAGKKEISLMKENGGEFLSTIKNEKG